MAISHLIGGHPALDLVNTYDNRFRAGAERELLDSFEELVRFAGAIGLLKPEEEDCLRCIDNEVEKEAALCAAHELREALSTVFYAMLDNKAVAAAELATLERHFKNAAWHRSLQWSDSRAIWVWDQQAASCQLPVSKLAQAAADFLASDDTLRVRACESPACRWLFLDNSKNHSRRWCDMKICGNRMKARRHHAAQRRALTSPTIPPPSVE